MNLALGSLYAWSVFIPPLEREFGWTRAETSWVYTIAIVCFALTFVAAGRLQDVKGPRICALAGGILVSAGFVLASFTTSLTMLYLSYGVVVGVGNGFGYATPTPVGSKWFPDRRGLVVGLMVGGYGAGSAIFGTLASGWLVPSFGWRTTFQILGAIFFVMTMAGTALLKNPPPGYRPSNWTPSAVATRDRLRHIGNAGNARILRALGRILPGHDGRPDDDQPTGAVRAFGGPRRNGGDALVDCQLVRQRRRTNPVGMDVRHARPRSTP